MEETEVCPSCKKDLRGPPIPEEYLRQGSYGEWDGKTPRYYSQKIGIEIQGVYDGVLFWNCPFCDHKWHRWPEGHHLRRKAGFYVSQEVTEGQRRVFAEAQEAIREGDEDKLTDQLQSDFMDWYCDGK
jgi:hypothetical protein